MTNCGKLLERWKYQTILPVSWETCMWGKKQQLEPCMEKLIGSRSRKEYNRAVCYHPDCLTYTLRTSWEMPSLDELQVGIKIGGRNINNLRYTDDTTLMTESEEELKSLLMWEKEESEKASLRLNILKNQDHGIRPHYCMANRRGKVRSSDTFPLLGLQNHCRWWLQPWNQKTVAFWQESNDKPRQCVEKQRHYSASKDPYSLPSGYVRLW